jgi:hypothetical protein
MTYLVLFSHVNSCIIPLHGNDLKTAASHIENIFGDKKNSSMRLDSASL